MKTTMVKLLTGEEVPTKYDNPTKVQISLRNHEGNLINALGNQNITKQNYTEKHTGVKVVLYYYNGMHIATYNKNTKTAILFY